MKDVFLVLSILGVFACGYFIMCRFDRFLDSSFRNEPPAYQQQTPSCMMLTEQLSDEEIIRNIRQFAAAHDHISIILRDNRAEESLAEDFNGNGV